MQKACFHTASEIYDPDKRDIDSPYSATSQIVSEFVQKHFKGLSNKPSIVEICMYTVTVSFFNCNVHLKFVRDYLQPDKDPFLDRHPFYHNVIIGAGFSGLTALYIN